jgi:hypothetical protein
MATRRRLTAVVLGMVVVVVLLVVACGEADTTPTTTKPPSTTTTPAPPATECTTSTTTVTTTAPPPTSSSTTTSPPTTTVVPSGSLAMGSRGPDVLALEQRLSSLGFWLGTPDADFGEATHHAVVAFQKSAGLPRDGVVGPAVRAATATATRLAPVSRSGRVVEIDLARQLLVLADAGHAVWVFDTSTGRVAGTTPVGHWTVYKQIDGLRISPLGRLWRPKYFHRGVAIHGFTSVPAYPASHGCVRVTYETMDFIWAAGLIPVGTPVWVR